MARLRIAKTYIKIYPDTKPGNPSTDNYEYLRVSVSELKNVFVNDRLGSGVIKLNVRDFDSKLCMWQIKMADLDPIAGYCPYGSSVFGPPSFTQILADIDTVMDLEAEAP